MGGLGKMTTTDAAGRTTGHPAKDSGGGTIRYEISERPYVRRTMRWLIDGRRGHMPIPPEDYARHWALEGPHA